MLYNNRVLHSPSNLADTERKRASTQGLLQPARTQLLDLLVSTATPVLRVSPHCLLSALHGPVPHRREWRRAIVDNRRGRRKHRRANTFASGHVPRTERDLHALSRVPRAVSSATYNHGPFAPLAVVEFLDGLYRGLGVDELDRGHVLAAVWNVVTGPSGVWASAAAGVPLVELSEFGEAGMDFVGGDRARQLQ